MKGLIITPTYNEEESILDHLNSIEKYKDYFDVLVVDDDSPDKTSEIVASFSLLNPWVKLINNGKKAGLGKAYKTGFSFALKENYFFVVQMDADGSHPYKKLLELRTLIETYEIVIGSRYVKGGKILNWSKFRMVLSKTGNLVARSAIDNKVKDVTGGFKAIQTQAISRINLEDIETKGYAFQIDLLRRLIRSDFSFIEIPIEFKDREKGASKMSGKIVLEALLKVLLWRISRNRR